MSDEVEAQSPSQIQRVTTEERAQALARLVSTQLALGNRRVESQTAVSAVLVRGKPINHLLHLLLCIPTVGIWALVWIGLIVFGGERREMLGVDDYGNATVSELGG